jgi:NAD-dependent deacetylase
MSRGRGDAETLAAMIAASDRLVVFTGAGISTESGIPDFRSPGGVWSQMKPIQFEDFVRSREMRREAWRRVYHRTAGWTGAAPNHGHHAVARLVQTGKASCVITQNVDNLHQDAGVPANQVIELHGNASYARCLDCLTRFELEELRPRWQADEDITCTACGGLIKTAVISFGQPMPELEMQRATEEAKLCDLFLVLGSSLVVYPAASLPIIARRAGARLVIVNREATDLDPYANAAIQAEIGPLMTDVVARTGL